VDIEQVLRPNPVELTLAFPRWRTVLATLVGLVVLAAPIAYGVYLAPGGYSRVLLAVILVPSLVFAAFLIRGAVVRLTGPPPALTTEGIRLRTRSWHKRLVDVSWSRATMMWIDYIGRQPVLNVVPSGRIGRRAPRPDAPIRPYVIPLPPRVRPDTVRDAVRTLSDGSADVLDRGFDDDGGARIARGRRRRETPMPWWQVILRYAIWLLVVVIGLPLLLSGPPPWNQPWWPGTTVAIRLPDPCRAVTGAEGTQVSGLPGTSSSDSSSRVCRIVADTSELTVTYRVHHTLFGSSVAAAAEDADDAAWRSDVEDRLDGVGDEAWIGAASYGTRRGGAGMHVVARRANVVVEVRYASRDDPEKVRTLVTGTARAALAAVRLG
jgi:hypothetical protein